VTLKRLIVVSLMTTTLASCVFASAASLGGISGGVAAGDSAIPACDTDGLTVTYETTGGNVTAVTVSALADPACEGGELSLTLSNAGGDSIASGGPGMIAADADAADNAVTVPVAPNPAAETVRGYHVSIVGP
jgi:hypothetical protein